MDHNSIGFDIFSILQCSALLDMFSLQTLIFLAQGCSLNTTVHN